MITLLLVFFCWVTSNNLPDETFKDAFVLNAGMTFLTLFVLVSVLIK